MAYAMTKQGSLDNCVTYEFICDTVEDMNAIENRYRTIGTVAIVLQGASGLEVYIAGSDKQWNSLSSVGGSAASDTAGLSIYICAQNEVNEGVPDVELPDEQTLYLVPAADPDSGNLYDEYIYVEDEWEKFGSGGSAIDLSAYATKANPVFTGSISLGRKANTTVGSDSIAIGSNNTASGNSSFAEGYNTIAAGHQSHAEGYQTYASGYASHAEGYKTNTTLESVYNNSIYTMGASGIGSHSEGKDTIANSEASHAEGQSTLALAAAAHTEGQYTVAKGTGSHAEGMGGTYKVSGTTYRSEAAGTADHIEGYQCLTASNQPGNHAEGYQTRATGGAAHAEGNTTIASGSQSHSEGNSTKATGHAAHAEGESVTAAGEASHAEGKGLAQASITINNTTYQGNGAHGSISHAEGYCVWAIGNASHAEGSYTKASGTASHAESQSTTASGNYSHAEGNYTTASGNSSHSEGADTTASGKFSHTEGHGTVAAGESSHAGGQYNVIDNFSFLNEWVANTSYSIGDMVKVTTTENNITTVKGYKCINANSDESFTSSKWTEIYLMQYAEIIGNGDIYTRSNARTLDWSGNERLMGDIYVGCNADSTGGTKLPRIPSAPVADGDYILKVSVSSGTPTYSWVAVSSLSGVTF